MPNNSLSNLQCVVAAQPAVGPFKFLPFNLPIFAIRKGIIAKARYAATRPAGLYTAISDRQPIVYSKPAAALLATDRN